MGIPWDGTGINCYGMGQINMSNGQPWWSKQEFLKLFNSNPFHCRHVVFCPKPDETNTRL